MRLTSNMAGHHLLFFPLLLMEVLKHLSPKYFREKRLAQMSQEQPLLGPFHLYTESDSS